MSAKPRRKANPKPAAAFTDDRAPNPDTMAVDARPAAGDVHAGPAVAVVNRVCHVAVAPTKKAKP